jgi:hypothetical protein
MLAREVQTSEARVVLNNIQLELNKQKKLVDETAQQRASEI